MLHQTTTFPAKSAHAVTPMMLMHLSTGKPAVLVVRTGLFAVVWVATTVFGQMATDQAAIELHPEPEDTAALTSFSFKNTGDRPVKILKIESSCGCLKAELDRDVDGPGETGSGTAEFKISSFVGRQEKTVHVTTDHPTQPEWVIPFILEVPIVIEIEPRTLQWWVGDDPDTKVCTVRMVGAEPMNLTKVSSTRESVTFDWKEIEAGRTYEIRVTPESTHAVLLGALKLETDSKIPKYQRQLAFFSIYRKPQAAEKGDVP